MTIRSSYAHWQRFSTSIQKAQDQAGGRGKPSSGYAHWQRFSTSIQKAQDQAGGRGRAPSTYANWQRFSVATQQAQDQAARRQPQKEQGRLHELKEATRAQMLAASAQDNRPALEKQDRETRRKGIDEMLKQMMPNPIGTLGQPNRPASLDAPVFNSLQTTGACQC